MSQLSQVISGESHTKKPAEPFQSVTHDELDWKMHARNMRAVKALSPGIARLLENLTETHSELVRYPDGGYDILFRDVCLYDRGASEWAKRWDDPNLPQRAECVRIMMTPPASGNLDADSNETAYRIMQRAVAEDIAFQTVPQGNDCFHLVVLGIGLGNHLPHLVERTKCRNLVLFEHNLEFLYWSLFVFDWDAFLKACRKRHCSVAIAHFQTADGIANAAVGLVRGRNPIFADSILLVTSYASSLLKNSLDKIMKDRNLFILGLGFLEDEIDMVRNSYDNLVDFDGRYYNCSESRLTKLPAFVVGAGPSLDKDLEFIRANRDRAVVVSCGTALRILLKNGIKPDFQMEMENVPVVTDLTKTLSEKHDLSGITLIATSTLDPGVRKYYDEVVFYFRTVLASYPIFEQGPESTVLNSIPTVANLGFSFAQEIGCREIYLFGVDLGTRDPKKHHASDAAYNVGEVEFTTDIDQPTPANFGGKVLSETIYLWSRAMLESAMKRFPTRNYFNCSDGVLIDGTIPRLSSSVSLAKSADKAAVIAEIVDGFPRYGKDIFEQSWQGYQPRAKLRNFTRSIIRKCAPATPVKDGQEDYRHGLEFLIKVARSMIPDANLPSAEMLFFRGSTFMLGIFIAFYYARIGAPEKKARFAEIAREELITQTKKMKAQIVDLYDKLEGKKERA